MANIKWGLAPADRALLTQVVNRANAAGLVRTKNRTNLAMDITACHLNGCPLDLQRLLDFPDLDFSHDVAGISRHLDRDTGQLTDHFLPRCARRARESDPVTAARLAALDLIFRAESVD